MYSKLFRLGITDVGHSIFLAAVTAGIGVILPVLSAGSIPTAVQFITSANAAIAAGQYAAAGAIAGILKGLLTNSNGELMKKEG